MNESMQDKQHYLFAVLLGIAGLLIILIFVTIRSQADDSSTSTTSISNSAPSIDSISVSTASATGADTSTVNPTEDSTTLVYVHGTYTENNGCDEVTASTITPTVYYTSAGSTCSQSEVNCYKKTSYGGSCSVSSCSGGTDESGVFSCTIPIFHFATNGGWTADVTVADSGSLSDSTSDTFTLTELTAISVPSTMDFGNVAYNGTSGTSTAASSYNVTNTGNDNATLVRVYGADLTCTDGGIDVGSIRITSSTSGCNTWSGMKQLTTASSAIGITITNATASTSDGYSTLCARINAAPESGSVLSGSCSGTATFIAY